MQNCLTAISPIRRNFLRGVFLWQTCVPRIFLEPDVIASAIASRTRSVFHQIHQTPATCVQMLVYIRIVLRRLQGKWNLQEKMRFLNSQPDNRKVART